jgi:hypothetical protein
MVSAPAPVKEEVEAPSATPRGPGRPASRALSYNAAAENLFPDSYSGLNVWANEVRALPHRIDDIDGDFPDAYDQMARHPHLRSLIDTLVYGIISQPLDIMPRVGAEHPDYEQALVYAQFCRFNIERLRRPFHALLYEMLVGSFERGHKIAELVYESAPAPAFGDGPMLLLKAIKPKPNNSYCTVVGPMRDLLGYLPRNKPTGMRRFSEIQADLIAPGKFLKFFHNVQDCNWNGTSLFRPLWATYWKGTQMEVEEMAYLAKYATPPLVLMQAPGTPEWFPEDKETNTPRERSRDADLAALKGLQTSSGLVHPAGGLVYSPTVGDGGDIFQRTAEAVGNRMAKMVLGNELTTEQAHYQPHGSVENNVDISGLRWRHHKFLAGWTIETDLFTPLIRFNFGEDALRLLPVAELGQSQEWDANSTGQMFNQAKLAGAVTPSQHRPFFARMGWPEPSNAESDMEARVWQALQDALLAEYEYRKNNPGGPPQLQPAQGANTNA